MKMQIKNTARRFKKVAPVNDSARVAKRVFVIGAFLACSFGMLTSRAVFFHLKDNAELEKVAMRQYRTAVSQSTKRGRILDAMGRELAIDTTVDSLYASPREIEEPVALADKLSKSLGIERRKLLERLTTGRKFAWVARRVDPEKAKAVTAQNFKGIYAMRESSRSYPGKTLASTIIGAVGFDSEPLGGIELSLNNILSSVGRSGDVKRDARGYLYLSPMGESEEAKISNVELTIDRTLQYIAERELVKAVEASRAKGGTAIIVDVETGAILAMANYPMFDPNEYGNYSLNSWKNRAVADAYEPGSTFKTVIVAAAIDAGVVAPENIFNCEGGSLKIGSSIVHDAHPHGKLSVADIVKVSSNIGAYKIEQRMGMKYTYDALKSFGFGKPSDIDLPGESIGLMSHHNKWSEVQFATIAFGQGISVTPIQMAMAFAAIANGGTLYKPYIVKRVMREDGLELYKGSPQVAGNPIGPETSRIMVQLLTRVTQKGGTGTQAASREYEVAGKTGTAQKVEARTGRYAQGKYYSSFIGFAPSNKPRIAVYVGIDEPSGGMYYGGQIAAPAFRDIVDGTLHYIKIPGSLQMTLNDDRSSDPSSSAELALINNSTEEKVVTQHDSESLRLPDFRGLTMRQVLEAAGESSIAWRFRGSGIAVRQLPDAGAVLREGGECTVEFEPLM